VLPTPAGPPRTFQLSFRATGETGVESSSIGAVFMGATVVSMKECLGVAFVVVCLTSVGEEGVSSAGPEGVVILALVCAVCVCALG
jgi:hypothetical protein